MPAPPLLRERAEQMEYHIFVNAHGRVLVYKTDVLNRLRFWDHVPWPASQTVATAIAWAQDRYSNLPSRVVRSN